MTLFSDVLTSVMDDANYKSKYLFDRNVFQKFIAVMFVNYATTDPMFYGINKADYAVSGAKDMDSTPLYIAIRKELTEIEQRLWAEGKGHALPDHPGIGYDAPHFGTGAIERPISEPA